MANGSTTERDDDIDAEEMRYHLERWSQLRIKLNGPCDGFRWLDDAWSDIQDVLQKTPGIKREFIPRVDRWSDLAIRGHFTYCLYNVHGQIIYVGVTSHLRNRIRSHLYTHLWSHEIVSVTYHEHETREAANHNEALGIRTERPIHNIAVPS